MVLLIISIKNAFDTAAKDYDLARKQLIPCFDAFYSTAFELLPFEQSKK
jgi:tRNA (cmo5U34)-methyltransferase